jgi:hypothetical protein
MATRRKMAICLSQVSGMDSRLAWAISGEPANVQRNVFILNGLALLEAVNRWHVGCLLPQRQATKFFNVMHIVCLKCVVSGGAFLAIAGYIILGIFFPSLRPYHHGTRVRLGIFSLVSAASLPLGWGIILFWLGTHLYGDIPVYWFGVPILLCICGSLVGTVLDSRAEQNPGSRNSIEPVPVSVNADDSLKEEPETR